MVQTGDPVKRQETFIKGKGDEARKHHVNAIINDDFWQVVKEEKLQEGDFKVESSEFRQFTLVSLDAKRGTSTDGVRRTPTDTYCPTSIDVAYGVSCIVRDNKDHDP